MAATPRASYNAQSLATSVWLRVDKLAGLPKLLDDYSTNHSAFGMTFDRALKIIQGNRFNRILSKVRAVNRG